MNLFISIAISLLFSMYIYTFFIAKQLDQPEHEWVDVLDADFVNDQKKIL